MKNVGRYPDRDVSLAHRQLARNRLDEVSMTDEQIQQILDGRVADYVTQNQVNAETSTKLTKSSLAVNANQYIDQSDVGSTYASLVNGSLPSYQRPSSPQVLHLETLAPVINSNVGSTSSTYGTNKVSVGSFTVPDPGYAYLPIVYASFEVIINSGVPPILMTIEDSSGRIIAGGQSTRSTLTSYNRMNVSPEGLPTAYLGSWTFTCKIRFREGSGSARLSNANKWLTVYPAPWTNK